MLSLWVPIYMPSALQLGGPYMSLTFAILAKERCFFGPTAKGATVGGLPLPKVLKNITNMFSSIIYCLRKLWL
jgi:hypothetical protein